MVDCLVQEKPTVKWADRGYQSKHLSERLSDKGIKLEIVKRPRKYVWVSAQVEDVSAWLKEHNLEEPNIFKVLPKRWLVERTFAWIGRYRRMSKDYEFLCATQETLIKLAMSRTMIKRIVKLKT